MAGKFNLTATGADFTFNSVAITCLQNVTISGSAPNTEVECSGTTSVENVVGLPRYTWSISSALETDDVTIVNGVKPAESGAMTFNTSSTAGDIVVTSTNGTVNNWSITDPINGFAQLTADGTLDDCTVAAHGA